MLKFRKFELTVLEREGSIIGFIYLERDTVDYELFKHYPFYLKKCFFFIKHLMIDDIHQRKGFGLTMMHLLSDVL